MFIKSTTILLAIWLTFYGFSGTAFAQTGTAEQQYNVGMTMYNAQNYTGAIDQWERLLASQPNYAEKEKVWYMTALAAAQSRNFEKAATYYDKIINQVDAQGKLVRGAYYDAALYDAGIAFYNYAEQLRQQNEQATAKTYALQAEKFFNQLCDESPGSSNVPQALLYLTRIACFYKQSAADTKTYAEKALQLIPENASAADGDIRNDCLFYRAWALGLLGQLADARRIFGTFIASRDAKRGPTSLYELAQTYYRESDYTKALNEMSSYEQLFPNDQHSKLSIQRLRAMCHYQLENYPQATQLLEQLIQQLAGNPSNILVEDYVWLSLCYLKTQRYDDANNYLNGLEKEFANTALIDGIRVLQATYHYETQNYADAANLINPILGTRQLTNGQVTFDMRPYNSDTATDSNKCGLSEEHFLMAASLLSRCYAKGGQMNTAQAIYAAMSQVSSELYGRYSGIRQRTLAELNKIAQSQSSGGSLAGGSTGSGTTPPLISGGTGSAAPPLGSGGTGAATPGIVVPGGTGNVVSGGTTPGANWGSSPGSTIQTGNNSLANRPLTLEQQEEEINSCATLAKLDAYLEEVLSNLLLLLQNPAMSKYNNSRAAVLRGQLLYEKKNDTKAAMRMFELAYEQIIGTAEQDSETFAQAAYYLGKHAEQSGKYTDAAKYYSESFQTMAGKGKFQDVLLYRWGTALLNIRGQEGEAIKCFTNIYRDQKESKYWSLAALQLATADYLAADYEMCEAVIDELIAKKPDKAVLDRVLYLKGELALRNKQWDIAADSFDALCVYASDSPFVALANQKLSEARSRVTESVIR